MDLNELMVRELRLNAEDEEEEEEDSQNLTWGGLRGVFNLPPNLPEDLMRKVIWQHLASQPLRRLFHLRLVSTGFRKMLTNPESLKAYSSRECCLLTQSCVKKLGCKHRGRRVVCWGAKDVLQKRVMPIPFPSGLPFPVPPPCTDPSCKESEWSSLDEWRVSSSHGGESGLLYLQRRAIALALNNRVASESISDWLVMNPVTKSLRQLPREYLGSTPIVHFLWSIDRIDSGYLSWATDGGERMYPLLLDSWSHAWRRIGSGFATMGPIRIEKAVLNGFVYVRYRKLDFKDRLIQHDILQGTFREVVTTGLPENMCDEHLFQYEGHIYLATVETGSSRGGRSIVIYQLESTEFSWKAISKMSSNLATELTGFYPALCELNFFHTGHELLVASSATERVTDGSHVFLLNESRLRNLCGRSSHRYPYCATAIFDITAGSWRKDGSGHLGPHLDSHTTVFRPRLDLEA